VVAVAQAVIQALEALEAAPVPVFVQLLALVVAVVVAVGLKMLIKKRLVVVVALVY
jgi:hypothetical protein